MSKSDGSTASYYELPRYAKELQDLISHKNMNAQIGEIFRACYRYGEVDHSDRLRDAKKIKYYAEAEIKRLEAHGLDEVERLRDKKRLIFKDLKDAVDQEWVGLTDDDIQEAVRFPWHYIPFARAIEAELKEKNT